MRLLLFSDLHLDTHFRWAGAALARARRQALRDTLRQITALARTHQADALLCAGDLYEHDRFSPDTAQFLRAEFESVDMPVFLAPGNHDWYGPQSLYRQVEWTPNVHLFTEDRFMPHELTEGLTLWGAAHRAPANTDGFVDGFSVDRGGVNLALFHGSETAAMGFQESGKLPHAPFTASEIESAGLDHAFVGHFHTARDAERHTYPGNPDPLTFGESAGRGVVLITVHGDGTVERERHDVSVSQVHDVTVHLDGVSHLGQVREQVIAAVAGLSGVVRVTITGEVAPDVDLRPADLATVAPHLDALVPRLGSVRVAYDLDSLAEEPTVRGQFVRDVRDDTSLDEATRRRVLITGLRALDGRASELAVH
ncbi:DNA repair exonuclease SbcCD nuclease subunit [Saccharothrix ecbatanensis]|uniref:DNA repair exonuclease SbcCD nuclease subunit n=1 Tax=Saccharothrix ecbatanensis TaxID=1105145 RepID=A0A7W9M5Z6_9PSEU|nr:metallophosphoesterase [Saccharothrix ecbatanensis]MBB5808691.1 DNA repair exonuclease SbcCD nuclease subunit [Saccharothrix ecbatanensis]